MNYIEKNVNINIMVDSVREIRNKSLNKKYFEYVYKYLKNKYSWNNCRLSDQEKENCNYCPRNIDISSNCLYSSFGSPV